MKRTILGALAATALTAASASAATIDFTTNAWNPGLFNNSATVGNTTVTSTPAGSWLSWNHSDGYGVKTGIFNDAEIQDGERLNVSFTSPFQLTSFSITNLFKHCFAQSCSAERGYYRLDGGAWTAFDATSNSGNLLVTLAPTWVSSLQFGFSPSYDGDSDFNVAELTGNLATTAPVPEPTSMLLLGSGLIGLASRLRKRRG